MKTVANMKPDFNLVSTFLDTRGRVVRAQVAAIRGRWQSIFLFQAEDQQPKGQVDILSQI
jgi:hypothetical protein